MSNSLVARINAKHLQKLRKAIYLHDKCRRKNIRLIFCIDIANINVKSCPSKTCVLNGKCFTLSHANDAARTTHTFTPYNKYLFFFSCTRSSFVRHYIYSCIFILCKCISEMLHNYYLTFVRLINKRYVNLYVLLCENIDAS